MAGRRRPVPGVDEGLAAVAAGGRVELEAPGEAGGGLAEGVGGASGGVDPPPEPLLVGRQEERAPAPPERVLARDAGLGEANTGPKPSPPSSELVDQPSTTCSQPDAAANTPSATLST